MIQLKVKKIHDDAIVPKYQHKGDAGFDICAYIKEKRLETGNNEIVIWPKQQCMIKTGLIFEIPYGYEIQVRPRSGLAAKNQITVTNSPGTIDCGYRGEICVLLYNLGDKEFIVKDGERIAQCVLNEIPECEIIEILETTDTTRGSGGFGSTGIK